MNQLKLELVISTCNSCCQSNKRPYYKMAQHSQQDKQ